MSPIDTNFGHLSSRSAMEIYCLSESQNDFLFFADLSCKVKFVAQPGTFYFIRRHVVLVME